MSDTYVVKNNNGWYAKASSGAFGLTWQRRTEATKGTREYAVRMIRLFYREGGQCLCWPVKLKRV